MSVRSGVGMIVAVTALAVAGAASVVLSGNFAEVRGRMAVRSARARFLDLHGHSRTLAVERGIPVSFVVDPSAQTVTLREGCDGGGRVLETRDFNLSYRVDVRTGGMPLRVCMTPRGYADPGSNSFVEQGTVTFQRGAQAASVVLFPLGQALES